MAKSFEERAADFKHRMSRAFPWTTEYHPKGKELRKMKSELWRNRTRQRFKIMTGGDERNGT